MLITQPTVWPTSCRAKEMSVRDNGEGGQGRKENVR